MDDGSPVSVTAGLLPRLTLVLGGARSGKSRHAEALVRAHACAADQRPVYIATAEAGDAEMAARIAEHRARRGAAWHNREAPIALGDAIAALGDGAAPILIDCLTLWLSNLILAGHDIGQATADLLARIDKAAGPVVCVANEVGLGIVPDSALGRTFRDHAGRLNQTVAAHANRVDFVAAGLPITLKSAATSGAA